MMEAAELLSEGRVCLCSVLRCCLPSCDDSWLISAHGELHPAVPHRTRLTSATSDAGLLLSEAVVSHTFH